MTELRQGRVVRVDAKVCHVDLGSETIQVVPRGSLFENLAEKNPGKADDDAEDREDVHLRVVWGPGARPHHAWSMAAVISSQTIT